MILATIKSVLEEYRETAHLEKGYLNESEACLKEWVESTLGKYERMHVSG